MLSLRWLLCPSLQKDLTSSWQDSTQGKGTGKDEIRGQGLTVCLGTMLLDASLEQKPSRLVTD